MANNTHLEHIGKMLKKAREIKGFSQQEIANAAVVRQATIADIENGKSNFEINTLVRICTALDVTLDISIS